MKYLLTLSVVVSLFSTSCESKNGSDPQTEKQIIEFIQEEFVNDSEPYQRAIERSDEENIAYAPNGEFDLGTLQHQSFTNDYFSFSLEIPTDWTITTEDQLEIDALEHKNELIVKDSSLEEKYENSESNWYPMLTLQHLDYQPSIHFMAENIDPIPTTKNAIEYLEYTRWFFMDVHGNDNYPIYYNGEIGTANVAEKPFLYQLFLLEYEDSKLYQKTYCAQYGDYLLNIVTTFENDAQNESILNLLESIEWMTN